MSESTQTSPKTTYTGRFAPSPTGPLHLGSLFTALASYLDARARNGKWLLRIDDLDTPRNQPGAAESILRCLEIYGLHWDDNVYYQSRHISDYEAYLASLRRKELTYRCECSRKTLAEQEFNDNAVDKASIYPGYCRDKRITAETPHAIRIRTGDTCIAFNDRLQGLVTSSLATQHGDFVLKRKDGIIAYQLAVVIDDYLQNITHVVRGCDLLHETPKQVYLQQLLGAPAPAYSHVPIIVDQHGYKLSKQTLATAVNIDRPKKVLFDILMLLKQNPPDELKRVEVSELLRWGIDNWNISALMSCHTISC